MWELAIQAVATCNADAPSECRLPHPTGSANAKLKPLKGQAPLHVTIAVEELEADLGAP